MANASQISNYYKQINYKNQGSFFDLFGEALEFFELPNDEQKIVTLSFYDNPFEERLYDRRTIDDSLVEGVRLQFNSNNTAFELGNKTSFLVLHEGALVIFSLDGGSAAFPWNDVKDISINKSKDSAYLVIMVEREQENQLEDGTLPAVFGQGIDFYPEYVAKLESRLEELNKRLQHDVELIMKGFAFSVNNKPINASIVLQKEMLHGIMSDAGHSDYMEQLESDTWRGLGFNKDSLIEKIRKDNSKYGSYIEPLFALELPNLYKTEFKRGKYGEVVGKTSTSLNLEYSETGKKIIVDGFAFPFLIITGVGIIFNSVNLQEFIPWSNIKGMYCSFTKTIDSYILRTVLYTVDDNGDSHYYEFADALTLFGMLDAASLIFVLLKNFEKELNIFRMLIDDSYSSELLADESILTSAILLGRYQNNIEEETQDTDNEQYSTEDVLKYYETLKDGNSLPFSEIFGEVFECYKVKDNPIPLLSLNYFNLPAEERKKPESITKLNSSVIPGRYGNPHPSGRKDAFIVVHYAGIVYFNFEGRAEYIHFRDIQDVSFIEGGESDFVIITRNAKGREDKWANAYILELHDGVENLNSLITEAMLAWSKNEKAIDSGMLFTMNNGALPYIALLDQNNMSAKIPDNYILKHSIVKKESYPLPNPIRDVKTLNMYFKTMTPEIRRTKVNFILDKTNTIDSPQKYADTSLTGLSTLSISNLGLHHDSLDGIILWGNIRYYFTTKISGNYNIVIGHVNPEGDIVWSKISDWMRGKKGQIIEKSFGATLVKAAIESFGDTLPILNLGEFDFQLS